MIAVGVAVVFVLGAVRAVIFRFKTPNSEDKMFGFGGALVFKTPNSEDKMFGFGGALVAVIIAVFALLISSFTIVEAKQVGVVTEFGKPVGTLERGPHLIAPWKKVTQIDGTIQTDEYKGDKCLYVRIGDGSTACVTATNRWRVNAEYADTIYGDYRSDNPTESLRDAVVSTQFKSAVNSVFGKYNPVAGLDAGSTADLNFSPDYDAIAKEIEASMQTRLGSNPLVKIESVTVSYLKLSAKTQDKIDQFQAEVAKTRIAQQAQATAQEQAAANKALSDSVSDDPNVLVSRCLDIMEDMVAQQQGIPAGFTCWPGNGQNLVLSSK